MNTSSTLEKRKYPSLSIKIDNSAVKAKLLINGRRFIVYLILIFLSVLCIFPFYILIINCTRAHYDIQKGFSFWFGNSFVNNYNNLMSDTNIPIIKAFENSLLIASLTAILTVYFSCLTAYAIHQYNFKFKSFLFTFILMIMMVPNTVSSLGLIKICSQLNLLDTYYPLILPSIAAPIVVFYMKQYLDSVLPNEMVEAARVDGASELRIFHQIVLPILKPAMAVQFIFSFVGSWNNYFIPALVIQSTDKKTLPLLIAQMMDKSNPSYFNMGKVYMMMTLAIVPLLIVYLIFSRFIIKGVTLGSVKG